MKGGITLACSQSVSVPVCLTQVFNVVTGALVSQSVACNSCPASASFDPATNQLTINTPLTYDYSITINDNLSQTAALGSITSP